LRKLAARKMAQEKPGQTLQATALVHEAYLRLVDVDKAQHWTSRGHFFAAAADAMRKILIENARRKHSQKRGGDQQRIPLDAVVPAVEMSPDDMLAFDEALERLSQCDPTAAELVKLRCFAGLSVEEAAGALNISARTAYRDWAFAQAWIYRELRGAKA
jgi:RNA polymerase sigma factor (TIGR02999 family)